MTSKYATGENSELRNQGNSVKKSKITFKLRTEQPYTEYFDRYCDGNFFIFTEKAFLTSREGQCISAPLQYLIYYNGVILYIYIYTCYPYQDIAAPPPPVYRTEPHCDFDHIPMHCTALVLNYNTDREQAIGPFSNLFFFSLFFPEGAKQLVAQEAVRKASTLRQAPGRSGEPAAGKRWSRYPELETQAPAESPH